MGGCYVFSLALLIKSIIHKHSYQILNSYQLWHMRSGPGHLEQLVTCLAADACLAADPGVESLLLVRSHTFVEIDHEIFLRSFSSLPLIQEGLLSVISENMYKKHWLTA